jgi:hypothetical protein
MKNDITEITNAHLQGTLTGLFFLSLHNDNRPKYQGYIIRKITDDVYAARVCSALTGEETIVRLFNIKEMMNWHFYNSNEEMLFRVEYGMDGVNWSTEGDDDRKFWNDSEMSFGDFLKAIFDKGDEVETDIRVSQLKKYFDYMKENPGLRVQMVIGGEEK